MVSRKLYLGLAIALALALAPMLGGCRLGGDPLKAKSASPSAPASVALKVPAGFSLDSGPCLGPITLTARDAAGSAMTLQADLAVPLSATSGRFYSDSGCATPLGGAGAILVAGSSQASLYYKADPLIPLAAVRIEAAPSALPKAALNCALDTTNARILNISVSATDGNWDTTSPAVSSFNSWIYSFDGNTRTPITRFGNSPVIWSVQPSFSPDGKQVLYLSGQNLDGTFTSASGGTDNLWISSADGSSRRSLSQVTTAGFTFGQAHFSPDGKKIYYLAKAPLDGSWTGTPTSSWNLWVMNADGSQRVPLTRNTAAGLNVWDGGVAQGGLNVSSDGNWIIVASTTALDGSWDGVAAAYNVWAISSDGSVRRALTQNTATATSYAARITRDGTKVVYLSNQKLDGTANATVSNASAFNYWVMNFDATGTGKTPITQFDAIDPSFQGYSLSPDSTRIAYADKLNLTATTGVWDLAVGKINVWVQGLDGSGRTHLTSIPSGSGANALIPTFSPAGDRIFFTSNLALDGNPASAAVAYNLWSIGADGSGMTPLTQNTAGGTTTQGDQGGNRIYIPRPCTAE